MPNDRVELERLVRSNLALDGPFDHKTVAVSSMDPALLNEVVEFCIREGNRDRLFWICDETENNPFRSGVRMNVLIRDVIRKGKLMKVPKEMNRWRGSTWSKARGTDGPWTLIEDNVEGQSEAVIAQAWSDVVVFHHPPGVYEDSGRGAYIGVRARMTPKKNDFEKSIQPKVESPKGKKMFAVKSKAQPRSN